ncbi:MAG: 2-isopropylmalate synthase [Candidatus Thiocaldithrix dubininis]|uniref:2-isopropylmalate synthase n=1 Tax=Candidatus Thiocaldithrix dubininis TaxID=3080823 RepID=A0AA95H202_9GAMM|nr:MAG: 2-isopropylmalate synthase [Candidatus Thiocaldithrix dubininis]
MLTQPNTKYQAFAPVKIANRQWPNQTLTQAPIWMSTDLRDGNQALFEPMDKAKKLALFHRLCGIGFKQIEVAFPSASQTDFEFVRELIEGGHIPADVSIEVLTQAREHLIQRTIESLIGAKQAIVHVYNATSETFRDVVFGMDKTAVIDMAVKSVQLIKALTAQHPETQWTLEYSPETFTATELDFALEVCNAVSEAWGATPDNKVILNLPATVEVATPNVYADQIEWMHTHLARRDSVIISVHPHNDRGTAVAAAELAMMAGAERVEGCLFGNGERTGNVDLVTLALNLYTQGISPNLDFSDINGIARTVEACTQLPIHPRHPYVGDLVFTAFSGSHQDAIKKGFHAQQPDHWNVPYLPIDPRDVGRSYDSVIRVNSQSGKGGIAYLMEQEHGIIMPRRLQIEFAGIVQHYTDQHGGEIHAATIWQLFQQNYVQNQNALRYVTHHLFESGNFQGIRIAIEQQGQSQWITGAGNGPIDAAVQALQSIGIAVQVRSYEERSMSVSQAGGNAKACAFIELSNPQTRGEVYGVGIDENIITASIKALMSAVNRSDIATQAIEKAA